MSLFQSRFEHNASFLDIREIAENNLESEERRRTLLINTLRRESIVKAYDGLTDKKEFIKRQAQNIVDYVYSMNPKSDFTLEDGLEVIASIGEYL